MADYSMQKQEIQNLLKTGEKMYNSLCSEDQQSGESKELVYFIKNYEQWYTKACAVIKQLAPGRLNDFTLLYTNPKRKDLDVGTYCISDALRTIIHSTKRYGPWTASLCLYRQIAMVQACLESFDSKVYNIQAVLQADIFDSEIESAKHLCRKGFLRAAGAICGVVIEKHFAEVGANHSVEIKKKSPTIADYNDAFKENVYDTIEWRRIQRLGDIRNLCDHNKDREPTKEEVDELISGTEKVIKTIF